MRRRLVALSVISSIAGACSSRAPSPVGVTASATQRPRLVVLVVIDQWPSWIWIQQKSLFTGGLARLARDGAIVDAAELPHANTFTAAGHSVIGTGAVPRVTGIVGNTWYRRDGRDERPAEYDPAALPFVVGAPLGGTTLSSDDGASGRALRVDGIADALRTGTDGAGLSVAIALKPRSACLVAGQRPDLAIWYEPGAGGMTTSSAYATELPAWLRDHAAAKPARRFFDATWQPRDPGLLARATAMADDAPGETSNHDLGATFPHALTGNRKAAFAIQETPFGEELVVDTVTAALAALPLGRDDVPDLLAVSFGAHDYAGHSWGPESWEVLDLTQRLDRHLGALFTALDTRLGVDQWAVVVTSDHGATPLVETGRYPGARRIPIREITGAAQQAIESITGRPGPWIAKLVSGNLWLTEAFGELAPDVRTRALEAAVAAIRAVPNIAGAVRADTQPAECTSLDGVPRAVCSAIVPGDAGELFVYPVAGSLITNATSGTSHDAPFEDNRRVPILVMAPGVPPQHGEGSLLQVAPTVAALLGVAPPTAARAAPLFGITRR